MAKEWKSLNAYHKSTKNQQLPPSDWLKSDRVKNTIVWQKANKYNLQNNLSKEYRNIVERRDFYKWLYTALGKKGHEVVWVQMAHYISKKLHLIEAFPHALLTRQKIKTYANLGSVTVFKNAFPELKTMYNSDGILKGKDADVWDETILKLEQFNWIANIYETMDEKSLHTLVRIAKGKCLYALVVPKAIRFKGELSNAKSRYNYALEMLKPYCENRY